MAKKSLKGVKNGVMTRGQKKPKKGFVTSPAGTCGGK